jgi:hypothetical protein
MKITNFSATTKSLSRSAVHALLITLFTLVVAPASMAGKPDGKGGGKGGSDGPPVEYEIHDLGMGNASGINDFGEVVGRNVYWVLDEMLPVSRNGVRAMRFTPGVGTEDLNSLGASWVDLDQPDAPVTDWVAVSAQDVNDLGQIVGVAENSVSLETGVFLFEPDASRFTIMPGVGPLQSYEYEDFVDINNFGVIAARNQALQIGDIFIYTPNGMGTYDTEIINTTGGGAIHLNDSGWLVGNTTDGIFQIEPVGGSYVAGANVYPLVEGSGSCALNNAATPSICSTKNGNNWKTSGPFKVTAGNTFADAAWFYQTNSGSGKDINDDGDVLILAGVDRLYYEDGSGTGPIYTLEELIAPDYIDVWESNALRRSDRFTNRDPITGFPIICVHLKDGFDSPAPWSAYLLVPRIPQQ